MKTRKEIIRDYKMTPRTAGVFMIKNKISGKIFLCSSINTHGALESRRFQLNMGSFNNRELQKDWKELGEEKFQFETLETVTDKQTPDFNLSDELELLEMKWIEVLNPFAPNGYNVKKNIRVA